MLPQMVSSPDNVGVLKASVMVGYRGWTGTWKPQEKVTQSRSPKET